MWQGFISGVLFCLIALGAVRCCVFLQSVPAAVWRRGWFNRGLPRHAPPLHVGEFGQNAIWATIDGGSITIVRGVPMVLGAPFEDAENIHGKLNVVVDKLMSTTGLLLGVIFDDAFVMEVCVRKYLTFAACCLTMNDCGCRQFMLLIGQMEGTRSMNFLFRKYSD